MIKSWWRDRSRRALGNLFGMVVAGAAIIGIAAAQVPAGPEPKGEKPEPKGEKSEERMHRVIVTLKGLKAGEATPAAIAAAQDQLLSDLAAQKPVVIRRYTSLPNLTLSLSESGVAELKTHPAVARVDEDASMSPDASSGLRK